MPNHNDLLKQLKEQTDTMHNKAHELEFFKALENHTLPKESYIGQLHALAIILGALERELKQSSPWFEHFIALGYKEKLSLLLEDLHFLEQKNGIENKAAIRAALSMADDIMLIGSSNPIALLGYLYTLEGSLMGAQMLRSALSKQFDLPQDQGSKYFNSYGKDIGSYWKSFKSKLITLISENEYDDVINASNATFKSLINVYELLYPLQEDTYGTHSAVLNPEAGEHPVPRDPDVLAAAIEASRECWYAFPYFELRYGERGYRFGISDVAWLSTLIEMEQPLVNIQVEWFAKVLSNRGMPSIILIKQLETLHETLSSLSKDQQENAEKLLHAAQFLQERNSNIIKKNLAEEFAIQFEKNADRAFSRQLRNSGTLIVSAVIDEHLGYKESVSSLIVWLGDKTHFSTQWSNQVNETVHQVRSFIK